jgi:hypothetical protein
MNQGSSDTPSPARGKLRQVDGSISTMSSSIRLVWVVSGNGARTLAPASVCSRSSDEGESSRVLPLSATGAEQSFAGIGELLLTSVKLVAIDTCCPLNCRL